MPRRNADIAKRAYEAFNRGGVEAILEFLDPEIEWRMWEQFARDDRVYHGHDGVRDVVALFEETLDDLRVDAHELIEVDDRVVVPVRIHGRAKGTGEEVGYELVQVWTTQDGKTASRLDAYSDVEEARAAVRSGETETAGDAGAA